MRKTKNSKRWERATLSESGPRSPLNTNDGSPPLHLSSSADTASTTVTTTEITTHSEGAKAVLAYVSANYTR